MNFLAHCLIADQAGSHGRTAGLVAGGFLGDFIKGTLPEEMPAELKLGVRLHRRVDAYSNRHPGIRRSCERFPPELRRLAPVLVDIVGDHLLARSWVEFHPQHLPRFTRAAYATIAAHEDWLPEHGQRFLRFAAQRDLLASYIDWQVVARALTSITRRLDRSELDGLLLERTRALLEPLAEDFEVYFPDLLAHAVTWVEGQTRS